MPTTPPQTPGQSEGSASAVGKGRRGELTLQSPGPLGPGPSDTYCQKPRAKHNQEAKTFSVGAEGSSTVSSGRGIRDWLMKNRGRDSVAFPGT